MQRMLLDPYNTIVGIARAVGVSRSNSVSARPRARVDAGLFCWRWRQPRRLLSDSCSCLT